MLLQKGMKEDYGEEKVAKVRTSYLAMFSEVTGRDSDIVVLDQPTLGRLVETVGNKYGPKFREALFDPDTDEFMPGVAVLVNGRRLPLDAKLNDGDEVAFLVAYAGG